MLRWVVRTVLVLILIGMLLVAYRTWDKERPDYYWERAQAALDADDAQTARIHLQNLLAAHPQHALGHRAMGNLLLANSSSESATPQTQQQALEHLSQAAQGLPDDLQLQKRLMVIWLTLDQPLQALPYAERVLQLEPDNRDALLTRAWAAVAERKHQEATAALAHLGAHPAHPFYRTRLLIVQNHLAPAGDAAQRDAALEEVLQRAAEADAQTLAALPGHEQQALRQLLTLAVLQSSKPETAYTRLQTAIRVEQQLSSVEASSQPTARVTELVTALGRHAGQLSADSPLADEVRTLVHSRWQTAVNERTAALGDYFVAGRFHWAHREIETALDYATRGLQALGDHTPAEQLLPLHDVAARALVALRRPQQAQPHLDALLAHSSTVGTGHLYLAELMLFSGRCDQSLKHLDAAQRRLGVTPRIAFLRANTLLTLQRWEEALAQLEQLKKIAHSQEPHHDSGTGLLTSEQAQVTLAQLQVLLALGRWEEAQTPLTALSGTPHEPAALLWAARYHWNAGDQESALATLAEARAKHPHDLPLLKTQTDFWAQQGELEQGAETLAAVAAERPDDLGAQLLQTHWQLAHGDRQMAIARLIELEQQHPSSPLPVLHRAAALLEDGHAEEARDLARQLDRWPQARSAMAVLVTAAELKLDHLDAAYQELRNDALLSSSNHALRLLEAELAAARGDYLAAIETAAALLDVTRLGERARETLLRSFPLLVQSEGLDAAQAQLAPLLQAYRNDPYLLIVQADLQVRSGELEAALATLDQVEKLHPRRWTAPYLKAQAWAVNRQPERAWRELNRALQIAPDDVQNLTLAAQLKLAEAKYADALAYVQKALASDEQLTPLRLLQAEILHKLSRTEEAIALLEELLAAEPKHLAARRLLVQLYFAHQAWDKAAPVVTTGRKLFADDFQLLADEITLLVRRDQAAEAAQLAQRAAEQSPRGATYLRLAQAFYLAEAFETAQRWAERVLEREDAQQQVAAHLFLGSIAMQRAALDRQYYKAAHDAFVKARELDPDNFVAVNNLAWLLATEQNQPDQALQLAQQYRAGRPAAQLPAEFVDTLLMVYRKADQLSEARQLVAQALLLWPDDARMHFHDGMLQAAFEQPDNARQSLTKALELGLPDAEQSEAQRLLNSLAATDK